MPEALLNAFIASVAGFSVLGVSMEPTLGILVLGKPIDEVVEPRVIQQSDFCFANQFK
jgi:hypothetical protein